MVLAPAFMLFFGKTINSCSARSTGFADPENSTLRKTESTYKETNSTYSGGKSVSRAENVETENSDGGPTNEPTDQVQKKTGKPTEAEVFAGISTDECSTTEFVELVARWAELNWREPMISAIVEKFEPLDWRSSRVWLLEKLERLGTKYSAYGAWDMTLKDIQRGEPPAPPAARLVAQQSMFPTDRGVAKESSRSDERKKQRTKLVVKKFGDVWKTALEELEGQVSQENFTQWFSAIEPGGFLEDGKFVCVVQDEFFKMWISDNYLDLIEAAVSKGAGRPVDVSLKLEGAVELECWGEASMAE